MPISRVVEYVIWCDNDECPETCSNAFGWRTRAEAIEDAPKRGWVRCTRNRWLCKRCAERLLEQQSPRAEASKTA